MVNEGDAARRRVERLVTSPGTLEFRILADAHHDKAIIDRAMKEPSKSEVLDSSGKKVAWWVPLKAGSERSVAGTGYAGIARRSKKSGDRDVTEILVVADAYNVTDAYLMRVEASSDRRGQPCINFTFNAAGGKLFAKLTGDHLPDKLTGFSYKLGIILDGELYSAPGIQSVISDSGEITGSLTKEDASEIVDTLNAERLPVRLRLVQVVPPGVSPSAAVPWPTKADSQAGAGKGIVVERAPSQAQPDLLLSRQSMAKPPELRFLAWQDKSKPWPDEPSVAPGWNAR